MPTSMLWSLTLPQVCKEPTALSSCYCHLANLDSFSAQYSILHCNNGRDFESNLTGQLSHERAVCSSHGMAAGYFLARQEGHFSMDTKQNDEKLVQRQVQESCWVYTLEAERASSAWDVSLRCSSSCWVKASTSALLDLTSLAAS